jgi:poly-gamma-glutamate synthesis protein (capsule biosynthesis protein)
VFAAGTIDSGIERDWAAAESTTGVALLPDLSEKTVDLIAERVARVKQPGDIAVLSIHWGENWGYEIPRQHRRFSRKLIDLAKIDVVHGHSSHHPKGIEIYKSKAILYGCGDFLNDYEGIAGYEEFRSHLVLAYFATIDSVSGNLLRLEMAPFQIRRIRLQRATDQDAAWLSDLLTREALGARTNLDPRKHLILSWEQSK